MKQLLLAAMIATFACGSAFAQTACESKAYMGKNNKPLSGAAKTSAITKCKKDACEPQAVAKTTGKPLSGAAKTSFMTSCEKGA